ncbi:hypothetical protein HZB89_01055 [archaeon]|nr:hypothetical protein [archaeon]
MHKPFRKNILTVSKKPILLSKKSEKGLSEAFEKGIAKIEKKQLMERLSREELRQRYREKRINLVGERYADALDARNELVHELKAKARQLKQEGRLSGKTIDRMVERFKAADIKASLLVTARTKLIIIMLEKQREGLSVLELASAEGRRLMHELSEAKELIKEHKEARDSARAGKKDYAYRQIILGKAREA